MLILDKKLLLDESSVVVVDAMDAESDDVFFFLRIAHRIDDVVDMTVSEESIDAVSEGGGPDRLRRSGADLLTSTSMSGIDVEDEDEDEASLLS